MVVGCSASREQLKQLLTSQHVDQRTKRSNVKGLPIKQLLSLHLHNHAAANVMYTEQCTSSLGRLPGTKRF